MSSAANGFVHAIRKRSEKYIPRAKSGTFWFPGWIPMIQTPFNALQHESKTTIFHQAVPELHDIKKQKISVQPL